VKDIGSRSFLDYSVRLCAKDRVSKYLGLECQNMRNIGCLIQITSNIGSPKYMIKISEYFKHRVSQYLGLECQNMSKMGCQNILDQSVGICQR